LEIYNKQIYQADSVMCFLDQQLGLLPNPTTKQTQNSYSVPKITGASHTSVQPPSPGNGSGQHFVPSEQPPSEEHSPSIPFSHVSVILETLGHRKVSARDAETICGHNIATIKKNNKNTNGNHSNILSSVKLSASCPLKSLFSLTFSLQNS